MLLRLLGVSHHKFCAGLGDGPVGRAQPELSPQNPCNSGPGKAEAAGGGGGIPGAGWPARLAGELQGSEGPFTGAGSWS